MNFKRRVCLRLKDHTPGRYQLWKDLEPAVNDIFLGYGVLRTKILNKGQNKFITVEYDRFEHYSEAVIDACQFCAVEGLIIRQVYIRNIKTRGSQCSKLINQYKERKKA